MNILEKYKKDIIHLCRKHRVKSLYAFGSVLNESFNEQSDVDLIVDFRNMNVNDYADNYYDLKFALQDMLKRPIDLLERAAIKNPYFRQKISAKQQLVYG